MACSGGRLKGYDLENGLIKIYYNQFNVGGTFLNGITQYSDGSGNYLFLTDFSERKLYRYRIEDAFSTNWMLSGCDRSSDEFIIMYRELESLLNQFVTVIFF